MSNYITITRVKCDDMICGHVNIPYGTECETDENDFLFFYKNGEKKILCRATSERGYQWFAYNDDGLGAERKSIINDCIEKMSKIKDKDVKFEVFTHDATAMKYKKHPEDLTEWSWDREKVHKAPVEDLERIREIILKIKN